MVSKRVSTKKLKQIDGFGIFKGAKPFKREENDHEEYGRFYN